MATRQRLLARVASLIPAARGSDCTLVGVDGRDGAGKTFFADELAAAEDGDAGYEDTEATLLDPEDAAAIMSDDDLSLWDTQGADSWGEDYHDDDITDDVQKTKKNGASD